ncbi:MAG: energy-coupling factor transporter transmembrane component T family protein [Saccharofermentanales bacterium]|jgi:energy-coupling factor transport system permease protein|nr:energy-coupling factor transporter transmembrane protein EcfT [Bacillota bacterium]
MAQQIVLGQYVPGSSFLHGLDPRTKLISAILLMILTLSSMSVVSLSVLALAVLSLMILSRLKIGLILRTIRPIILLLVFAFLFNLFTGKGEIIFSYSFIVIREDGLIRAIKILVRLVLLVLSTSILITLTTTPILIADAIENLLGPLKRLRFPVHEISMMMSIALRFIPTLLDEMQKIMKAQSSRGADYDTGNALKRARGFVSILVPLFISSFRRADDLATAMEARCYRGGKNRTRLKVMKYSRHDLLFAVMMILTTLTVYALPYAFPGL